MNNHDVHVVALKVGCVASVRERFQRVLSWRDERPADRVSLWRVGAHLLALLGTLFAVRPNGPACVGRRCGR